MEHARAFGPFLRAGTRCLDLGSGGGVPGLVLAHDHPDTSWVLLDAGRRRVVFLEASIERLGLGDRVRAVGGRAEVVGRDAAHRDGYDAVVARGFGPAAVTAECGAPLVVRGGHLVVSDPPGPQRPGRWPAPSLTVLGLEVSGGSVDPSITCLVKRSATPDTFPRRTGVPGKRPLW